MTQTTITSPNTDYLILITDQNLTVVGDPIACWTSIDVTLRFNEPSSGLFTAPGFPWIREQMAPGYRVVVIRDQKILTAGPIEKWMYERSDDGENAGDGTLTVNFADDLALVVARLTYPDPTLTPSAQVIDNWTNTGNAEVQLRTLADLNAGPGALTDRRIPQLALGTLAGVGTSITSTAERMEPLGNVMRRIAVNGGGLGFRTRQENQQILFEVYQPQDKADQVVFGFGAGNLKYVAYEVTAPTATTAIVGGQGEGADRFLIERVNAGGQGSWGRMETLVNRPGNDPVADLNAAGDEALAEGAETARLPTTTADTPFQRYGIDYDLGTRVSVESWPGSMISDVVATVHVQAWPTSGEYVSSTVGSQAESSDPAWIQRMRAMDRRLGYLERNVMPAVAP
jgi:hypothetical protein